MARLLPLVILAAVVAVAAALVIRNGHQSVPSKIAGMLDCGGAAEQITRSRTERPDWYRPYHAAAKVTLVDCREDPTAAGAMYVEFQSPMGLSQALSHVRGRHGPFCVFGSAMFDGFTLDSGQPRAFCDELGGRLVGPGVHAEVIGGRARLTFPTPYVIGDMTRNGRKADGVPGDLRTAHSYDNYHVLLTGPAGSHCRHHRVAAGYGFLTTERRAPGRTVRFHVPRCPGRYTGTVEYFQPDRQPPIEHELLGRFVFTSPGSRAHRR